MCGYVLWLRLAPAMHFEFVYQFLRLMSFWFRLFMFVLHRSFCSQWSFKCFVWFERAWNRYFYFYSQRFFTLENVNVEISKYILSKFMSVLPEILYNTHFEIENNETIHFRIDLNFAFGQIEIPIDIIIAFRRQLTIFWTSFFFLFFSGTQFICFISGWQTRQINGTKAIKRLKILVQVAVYFIETAGQII